MKTKNFRDYLALFVGVLVIPGLWLLQGIGIIDLNGAEVIGATITIETTIIMFYFRKKNTEPTP